MGYFFKAATLKEMNNSANRWLVAISSALAMNTAPW